MATRPHQKIDHAVIQSFLIPSAKTTTKGKRVKFSGSDTGCEDCGAGEDGIGVALATGVAGDTVQVVLEGHAVVPVLVGTGGATRGAFAKIVADGYTDQAIADGTTPRLLAGKFMQSGVAGDLVGLLIGVNTPCSTA